MQESKYYYNGIPLSKYCKDNNINMNTIRTRIWKKKHNKKYEAYSDQEIVDIVIEAYGSTINYMYRGITLRKYCLDNGINVGTIYSRIANLRRENEELSDDELVILAMEEFDNGNLRFFYNGIPLKEYCEEHPEINYNTIRSYINREKEKNPELTDNELIEQYLNKTHKGIYKYYYLGIPLKKYCDDNNLNYRNIISYMSRYRNEDGFKDLSNDEFVEAIMDQYQPFEPKYVYKGMTLREYCIKNELSYYSVVSFVKRKIARGSEQSVDGLINEGINTINRHGIIYYYKGIPLRDYCLEKGLNVSSIRGSILRKQLRSDKPLQDIIDECVESYQKFSIKYYYEGVSLSTFCNSIGLSYNTVIQKYLSEYSDSDISIDEVIKQIVDYYIENLPLRTKYYFNDQSLAKFCDENDYPYLAIWRRIKTLESKGELTDSDEIIESAIKKYEDRLHIDRINNIFNELKSNKNPDISEIEDICNYLKIDLDNVCDLVDMGFSYSQAINMIWYFYDKTDDNEHKLITDNKIKYVFNLIDNLKDSDNDIEQFELYDLIGIYKSELYDSRNEILLRQKRYINKTLYSLCSSYGINVNKSNYDDFESEIKYYLLTVIDRTNLNNYGQIIKYMDLTVKGYFRTYLKEYSKHYRSLLLNDAKYMNDKGTKREKSMIDFVVGSKDLDEIVDRESFGFNMMKALTSLSSDDLSFVILKYQENYNDEELSSYFGLTSDEVKQREIKILISLRNNKNVKLLRKDKEDN